jgi:hypothetical protein
MKTGGPYVIPTLSFEVGPVFDEVERAVVGVAHAQEQQPRVEVVKSGER